MERADVFRYLVLWVHGGYYADVDVECLKPIATYQAMHNAMPHGVLGHLAIGFNDF